VSGCQIVGILMLSTVHYFTGLIERRSDWTLDRREGDQSPSCAIVQAEEEEEDGERN
jgi:hypothetical protein